MSEPTVTLGRERDDWEPEDDDAPPPSWSRANTGPHSPPPPGHPAPPWPPSGADDAPPRPQEPPTAPAIDAVEDVDDPWHLPKSGGSPAPYSSAPAPGGAGMPYPYAPSGYGGWAPAPADYYPPQTVVYADQPVIHVHLVMPEPEQPSRWAFLRPTALAAGVLFTPVSAKLMAQLGDHYEVALVLVVAATIADWRYRVWLTRFLLVTTLTACLTTQAGLHMIANLMTGV